jgi:hypothetical protein
MNMGSGNSMDMGSAQFASASIGSPSAAAGPPAVLAFATSPLAGPSVAGGSSSSRNDATTTAAATPTVAAATPTVAAAAAEKQKQWSLNEFDNGNTSSTAATSDGPAMMTLARENSGSAVAVEQNRAKQSMQGDALHVMRPWQHVFNSTIGNTNGGVMSPAVIAAANATAANAQARMTAAESNIINGGSHATPRLPTSVGFCTPTLFTGSVYHGGSHGSGSGCGVPGGLVGCLSPSDVGTSSTLELELAKGQELSTDV